MARLNLHLFWSPVSRETRLFKETQFTLDKGIFDRVVVIGVSEPGLKSQEIHPCGLEIRRVTRLTELCKRSWCYRRHRLFRVSVMALALTTASLAQLSHGLRLRPSHITCRSSVLLPISFLLALFTGAKLVYMPHELESERHGIGPVGRWATVFIERLCLKRSNSVVLVCDPIRDWYKAKYRLRKCHVIRNVPSSRMCQIHSLKGGALKERFRIPEDAIVAVLHGNLDSQRFTSGILDVYSRLNPKQYHLVLMGHASPGNEAEIAAYCQQHGNIHFQPPVPSDMIISHIFGADVGLLMLSSRSLNGEYSSPNKFFDYAHAGLAMIISDNHRYLCRVLRERGLGWSVPIDDLEQTITTLSPSMARDMGRRTKQAFKDAIWEQDAQVLFQVYS